MAADPPAGGPACPEGAPFGGGVAVGELDEIEGVLDIRVDVRDGYYFPGIELAGHTAVENGQGLGADILGQLHLWQRWREIAKLVPFAVIDRPGPTWPTLNTAAAHWLAPDRIPESEAALLPDTDPPAFVFLHGPRVDLSSTLLRQAGHRPGDC